MQIKKRSLVLVAKASLLPVILCASLLHLDYFSSYPSFSLLFWVALVCFYSPVAIAVLLLLVLPMTDERANTQNRFSAGLFGNKSLRLFGFLSVIFVLAIVYRYLVIGSVLELGVTGARYEDAISGRGGGIITGIYAFTIGAPAFLLLACISHYSVHKRIPTFFLLIAALGFAATFLSGGRNPFLINSIFVLAVGWIYPSFTIRGAFPGWGVRSSLVRSAIMFLFSFFVLFSLYIFYERALLRTDSMLERALIHTTENGLSMSIQEVPGWLSDSVYIILFYVHAYLTIAFYYMDILLSHGMPNGHLGGGYNFLVPSLVIEHLTGWDAVPNEHTDLPIAGAYYTLAGSIFIDFGIFGLISAGILIPLFGIIFVNMAISGKTTAAPLAAVFLTVLVLSPLYNAASLGSGFSLLFLSVLFYCSGGRKLRIY